VKTEFSGIERRLAELSERLTRLEPLRQKKRLEFDQDPYLRDIVERNLEVAAQCCIDICHRIISLLEAPPSLDYYDSIMQMGPLGVLPADFARHLAPLAGFRNILVHEYLQVDWDEVFQNLQRLEDLSTFVSYVRQWLQQQTNSK
jgi:uncharacterized protein YutE (UPF0331/DUF86 family)